MVQPDRPQRTTQFGTEKTRFACRITKARTDTHREYLTPITIKTSEIFCLSTTVQTSALLHLHDNSAN